MQNSQAAWVRPGEPANPRRVCPSLLPVSHIISQDGAAAAPQQQYEVEAWILNFARTLHEVTGLDPSA